MKQPRLSKQQRRERSSRAAAGNARDRCGVYYMYHKSGQRVSGTGDRYRTTR